MFPTVTCASRLQVRSQGLEYGMYAEGRLLPCCVLRNLQCPLLRIMRISTTQSYELSDYLLDPKCTVTKSAVAYQRSSLIIFLDWSEEGLPPLVASQGWQNS